MTLERYASGDWLTPGLMRFSAAAMLAATIAALGYLYATSIGTLDALGRPLGTDFSSFWTAGRLALAGQAPQAYDWLAHFALQRETHGTDSFLVPWSYPPLFLTVAAAIAVLPYVASLAVWQAASLLAGWAAFRLILPGPGALLFAAGFPAVLICLAHGQTGLVAAALFAGGVVMLDRREALAGVLFGLLAFKPQYGLLLPFVLAAGGYWRAIGAAAATVLGAAAATLAIWGAPVWLAFFASVGHSQSIVLEAGDAGFAKFQSAFAAVRLWGGPVALAYAAQGLVAAAALAGCVAVWRSTASLNLRGAALITASLLAPPYVLDYDLVAFGMALALFAAEGMSRGFARWEKTLLALAWMAPLLARALAQALHVPIGLLALVGIFALVVVKATAAGRRADRPAPALPQAGPA